MPLKTRRTLLFLVLGLLSMACTTLQVRNVSDRELRIQVSMPDGEGPVIKKLAPKGEVEFVSETGGRFQIGVLPSEEYIQSLKLMGVELSVQLWGAAEAADRPEMAKLIDSIADLNKRINALTEDYDHCTANVEQDEVYGVSAGWVDTDDAPFLNCFLPGPAE